MRTRATVTYRQVIMTGILQLTKSSLCCSEDGDSRLQTTPRSSLSALLFPCWMRLPTSLILGGAVSAALQVGCCVCDVQPLFPLQLTLFSEEARWQCTDFVVESLKGSEQRGNDSVTSPPICKQFCTVEGNGKSDRPL